METALSLQMRLSKYPMKFIKDADMGYEQAGFNDEQKMFILTKATFVIPHIQRFLLLHAPKN